MSTEIILPKRSDGTRETLPADCRQAVIIGANGAGKSRFTTRLADDVGARAFRMSALEALYGQRRGDTPTALDAAFEAACGNAPAIRPAAETGLDRLLALLMHDEMLNLLSYKLEQTGNPKARLRSTKLDKVIRAWRNLFPDNNVLIESGKMLFSRGIDERGYSAVKLSDGERAAIYYIGGVLYAPADGVVFVDSPEMFFHPTVMQSLWNCVESLRPDCTFIYTTHDLEFASSLNDATVIWVRDYDAATVTWDYALLPAQEGMSDELYMAIIGSRKPVLFIEGDGVHSIDAKLYPLVFPEYTVKSLGSCNKVIEATRTFNDLSAFHHLDSHGIVDRDRRDEHEVEYLRARKIMVPDVAEIENILMLEEVIRTVARSCHRDEQRVFEKVSRAIISQFSHDLRQQALLHTRHRVKRTVEYRIDGRFTNIGMLEKHMLSLIDEIKPRALYERLCREFRRYAETGDYASVLRVYNQKSMVPGSNVAALCGLRNKEEYVHKIILLLQQDGSEAARIRRAVKHCFGIEADDSRADRKTTNPGN